MAAGNTQKTPIIPTSSGAGQQVRGGCPFLRPAGTQVKSAVVTKLQGLLLFESKDSMFDKYRVRAMTSVNEVVGDTLFKIFRSKISSHMRRFPKNRVVVIAGRSKIVVISLSGRDAQELCKIINIFLLSRLVPIQASSTRATSRCAALFNPHPSAKTCVLYPPRSSEA